MRRAAGTGNDDFDSATFGGFRELEKQIRSAMRGYDLRLVCDTKLVEDIRRVLHRRPVRLAAHDDRNDGICDFGFSICDRRVLHVDSARAVTSRISKIRELERERNVDRCVTVVELLRTVLAT